MLPAEAVGDDRNMAFLWMFVLFAFGLSVLLTWPLITKMARERLLNVRHADGSLVVVEEQKLNAFRRIAFVFLLGTIMFSMMLFTTPDMVWCISS